VSDPLTRSRALLLAVATLLIAGCETRTAPTDHSTDATEKPAGSQDVTLYVAGMNDRLNIF